MTTPITDETIAQMLAEAHKHERAMVGLFGYTAAVAQLRDMRALAAECRRRIDPRDHEQTVQACLAYERENDRLRANLARAVRLIKQAPGRVPVERRRRCLVQHRQQNGGAMRTEMERAIWTAAYAAAIVADFETYARQFGYDRAVECATAERAWGIADHAVNEYRRWNMEERGGRGPKP